jgi:phosphohistidine phosphatase SixA
MLIGHEPVWSGLARQLSGGSIEVKTATVVVIQLPISDWADLPDAKGVMVALHHPRTYFGSEWDRG